MARGPKMERGKISLVRCIHCCPNLFFIPFARPASRCCEEYVYIYISDSVETVYELPLLPNNTAVKHFYTNGERCEMLTGYYNWGAGLAGTERVHDIGQNILQSFS